MATIAIPPLGINSYIEHDISHGYTSSANNKTWRVRLGATIFASATATTVSSSRSLNIISNRGATNSQLSSLGSLGNQITGLGSATTAAVTGAVDTSVSTNLTIAAQPTVANEIIALDRYIILVWR